MSDKKALTFESLKDFDSGLIAAAIDSAIQQINEDINDRPNVKAKRSVSLTLYFEPVTDPKGNHDVTNFSFEVSYPKLPTRKSAEYKGLPQRRGGTRVVLFSEFSPEDPRQEEMYDVDKTTCELKPKPGFGNDQPRA